MPVASEVVQYKRDEAMLTGFGKVKCPCCGHEFIAMSGGVVNAPARCPKCGTVIKSGLSSSIGKLLEIIFRK